MKKKLQEMGFNIDKHLGLGIKQAIYVDDTNKRFALTKGKELRVYDYKDLLGFELNEDGDTVVQGKGLATLVGGVTFGITGALVGAAGPRKNKGICTELNIDIRLNDLSEPRYKVNYLVKPMKKSGIMYQSTLNQAQELVALLTYIDKQN